MRHLWILLLLSGCGERAPSARAVEIASLDEAIGGPKAMGRPGDILLENDRVRFVILTARNSLGPNTSGGSLVDADLQRDDPRYSHGHGKDQFAELFPTVNLNVGTADPDGGTVSIIADGSDGGAAIVRTEGPAEPFLTLLGALWAIVGQPDTLLRTDYILEPGAGALKIVTTAVFNTETMPADADLSVTPSSSSETEIDILGLALESGAAFGDFYLQGGSVDVFAPEIGFDEDGYVYSLDAQGINAFETPIAVDYLAGAADGVSYALMADEGRLFVPLFTSSQTAGFGGGVPGDGSSTRFPEGAAYSYTRWLSVGHGDIGSAVDAVLEARAVPVATVSGQVTETGTGVALSGVHVFAFKAGSDAPWTEFETDVGEDSKADGSFRGTLPAGDWVFQAYAEGRPEGEPVSLTVAAGQDYSLNLQSPQPGSVSFEVVDETGEPVPAKLTFYRTDGADVRNTVLGDGYIAGAPAQVFFAPYGSGQIALPPGEYYAVASRGIEYDLATSEPFSVAADRAVELQPLSVVHSVNTAGWVSADLHVHAQHSFDSGTSLQARVSTMVCEGVEFLSSNDHDAVTDYAPVIEDMGLEPWISSAVGVEVTTLELGHFLGFPLVYDSLAEQGGAFDWTEMTPGEIGDSVRAMGVPGAEEPVVFVGHPRDGILGYFDQYGMNPYGGTPGNDITTPQPEVVKSLLAGNNTLLDSENFSTEFDGLELLNAKRFELLRTPTAPEMAAYAADPDSTSISDWLVRTLSEQADLEAGTYTLGYGWEGQIDDWFTLLNLGLTYTALGNSDTHSKTSTESGCPRNFIAVESDTPGFATGDEIAAAVKAHHVVASYGPFIRFWANDPENITGSTIVDPDEVSLHIEVESPNWFDIDRVELYENGTLIAEWSGEDIADGDINLDVDHAVTPTKDAWYVVIAQGTDDLNPAFTPVEIPPIQLQDVVIDALGGVPAVSSFLGPAIPIPRTFPVMPFALTNPIWVDQDGDGFDAPGLPEWLVEPEAPE